MGQFSGDKTGQSAGAACHLKLIRKAKPSNRSRRYAPIDG
jgi:hypothetical protein